MGESIIDMNNYNYFLIVPSKYKLGYYLFFLSEKLFTTEDSKIYYGFLTAEEVAQELGN